MKTKLLSSTVVAGLFFSATVSGWALPPRQHSITGVIESVDWTSRRISLKPAAATPALVLVWTDRTRFTKDAGCAKCNLAVGQAVSIYYRREVGQNVLREVSAKGGTCQQGQP